MEVVRNMKISTYLVLFVVALVCIPSLATAFEPKVVDANPKLFGQSTVDPLPSWSEV
jgi:hypothetical protein